MLRKLMTLNLVVLLSLLGCWSIDAQDATATETFTCQADASSVGDCPSTKDAVDLGIDPAISQESSQTDASDAIKRLEQIGSKGDHDDDNDDGSSNRTDSLQPPHCQVYSNLQRVLKEWDGAVAPQQLQQNRSKSKPRWDKASKSFSAAPPSKDMTSNNDSEDHSSSHENKSNAKGGIIFFHHIPKSGGTTIRKNLQSMSNVQYVFAKNRTTYNDTVPIVEDAIVNGTQNGSILVYEVHASSSPSLKIQHKRLARWRTTARANGIPSFFFTVVREDAIAYALSHFNFFHVQKRNKSFPRCNATLENFLHHSLPNPQCQFLYGGEHSMRASGRHRKAQLAGQVVQESSDESSSNKDDQGGSGDSKRDDDDTDASAAADDDDDSDSDSDGDGEGTSEDTDTESKENDASAISDSDSNPTDTAENSNTKEKKTKKSKSASEKFPAGVPVKHDECDQVFDFLYSTMDWVGLTETLSNITLPLLMYGVLQQERPATIQRREAVQLEELLRGDYTEDFRRYRVTKNLDKASQLVYMDRENLTQATLDVIEEMSALDTNLSRRISQTYGLDQEGC